MTTIPTVPEPSSELARTPAEPDPPTPRHQVSTLVLLAGLLMLGTTVIVSNPGAWMLHCHIAEHLGSGMMAVMRVD